MGAASLTRKLRFHRNCRTICEHFAGSRQSAAVSTHADLTNTMLSTATMPPPLAFAPPAPPMSAELEQLKSIFPEIEQEVLAALLSGCEGRIETVVATLLDTTAADTTQEVDARIAVEAQQEIDEQLARVIQQELQKEMHDERKQSELGPRAAAAAAATAAALKKRLQGLSLSALPLTDKKKKERSTRLLDADSASEVHENIAPLYSVSPLQEAYTPPVVAAPAVTPLAASTDRYESRMSRAREANMRRNSQARSSTREASPVAVPAYMDTAAHDSMAAVAVAVAVPEGELI